VRILHTSDWHLGRTLEGRSRLPEQEQFIDELVDIVKSEDVKLILLAGDVYDTYNPSADAERLFFDAAERLSDGGKRAIVAIAGNHDSPERLQAANPLAVKHGISLIGYPGERLLTSASGEGIQRISTGPGWLELMVPGCEEKVMIYALPYPSESRLNEILTEDLDESSQQIAYSERIGRLFRESDLVFKAATVNIALAHLFAFGGVESESERQLGGALAVTPQMMPRNAQYIALGHLHRPQQVHSAPVTCRYSGSPLSFSFSEADQQKEVVLLDAVPGSLNGVRPIHLNCGKPLKRWRANGVAEAYSWCTASQNQSCWVELEIMVDKPLEVSELAELRKSHSGIITIRPIFPESLTEASEVHRLSELSLVERFNLFFGREYGAAPPEDLVRFFLEMVNQSETNEETNLDNALPSKGGEVA
jgi:DNA repair protein SbcD/Mre11